MIRRTTTVILAVVVFAFLVDRVTLYLWQLQVIRLYKSLRATVAAGESAPPKSKFGYLSIGLEPLLVMPKSENFPIRYLTLRTDLPLAKPSTITVDGAGGLHLRFFPPPLAWTTRLMPRTDPGHHSDPVSVDSRLHYQYKIDIGPGDSDVVVELRRGPHHFEEPLKWDELSPQLFP